MTHTLCQAKTWYVRVTSKYLAALDFEAGRIYLRLAKLGQNNFARQLFTYKRNLKNWPFRRTVHRRE